MEFTVHLPDKETLNYHGESRYMIGENNAVLRVWNEDGEKMTYSPSAWLRIEESPSDTTRLDTVE
jgi:hypothetical protein